MSKDASMGTLDDQGNKTKQPWPRHPAFFVEVVKKKSEASPNGIKDTGRITGGMQPQFNPPD